MPSLKMKADMSSSCLKEKSCLGLCQKSSMISKRSCLRTSLYRYGAEFGTCPDKHQDDHGKQVEITNVLSSIGVQMHCIENDESIDKQVLPNARPQFVKLPLPPTDSSDLDGREFADNYSLKLEAIFSHALEHEVQSVPSIDDDDNAVSNCDLNVPKFGAEDSNDNKVSSDNQTCNVSDFFISDMIVAGLPFGEDLVVDDIDKIGYLPDSRWVEPNMLFDVAEECMMLPLLVDSTRISYSSDMKSCEETLVETDNSGFHLAISQIRSHDQESDLDSNSCQTEEFDPQLFIKNQPELSYVVSNFQSSVSPKESQRTKSITLVLDLDETLVHSTLEHCDDPDFTFTVFFNMKEHMVYVKQRPHLYTFLERVAKMFEIVIFTASQSMYADQLLNRLDPDGKLISRRAYRESCVFSDGIYTKDLTVIGADLAKIVIIDNSPQVFRFQVNNGIPIKSWFSDPSDCALISLLPFLETLVDADDVRPIIAQRFGNGE